MTTIAHDGLPTTAPPPVATSSLDIHPKVIGAFGGAQIAALIVWLLGTFHVNVDPVVALQLGGALVALCGWLAPMTRKEAVPVPVATSTTNTALLPGPQ